MRKSARCAFHSLLFVVIGGVALGGAALAALSFGARPASAASDCVAKTLKRLGLRTLQSRAEVLYSGAIGEPPAAGDLAKTSAELLEYGRAILKKQGTGYQETLIDGRYVGFEILPDVSGSLLNRMVARLQKVLHVRSVTFSPAELLSEGVGGQFDSATGRITLPMRSLTSSPGTSVMLHEIRHVVTDVRQALGHDSLFAGLVRTTDGSDLSVRDVGSPLYRKIVALDEMATYALTVRAEWSEVRGSVRAEKSRAALRRLLTNAAIGQQIAKNVTEVIDRVLNYRPGEAPAVEYVARKNVHGPVAIVRADGGRVVLEIPLVSENARSFFTLLDSSEGKIQDQARHELRKLLTDRLVRLRNLAMEQRRQYHELHVVMRDRTVSELKKRDLPRIEKAVKALRKATLEPEIDSGLLIDPE